MDKVFIGMPVYNGEQFMAAAIDSLLSQTYTNWKLLIADNNSTDKTGSIAMEYVKKDSRIHYIKHDINIGATSNFMFLLDEAHSDYFMWAAADDTWETGFLENCLGGLTSSEDVSLCFCNVAIIDSYHQRIRKCEMFSKFNLEDKSALVASYVLDAEFSGKANLIYGIYRLSLCRAKLIDTIPRFFDKWGGDMAVVLSVIAMPFSIIIIDKCLFNKRLVSADDVNGKTKIIANKYRLINGVPSERWQTRGYMMSLQEAVANTSHEALVLQLTSYREELTENIREFKEEIGDSPVKHIKEWLSRKLR